MIVREDTPGEKKLVGYIIPEDAVVLNLAELRNFLKTKIPDYMVPATFMVLEQFPVTLNGKVDRKLLPPPVESLHQTASNYIELHSETERKLAELFADIFKINQIGRNDNFFDLGGNSLLAAMLISRINKELKIVRLDREDKFDWEDSQLKQFTDFLEDILQRGWRRHAIGHGKTQAVRLAGPMVGILAENDHAHRFERRAVERVENQRAGRMDDAAFGFFGTQEGRQITHRRRGQHCARQGSAPPSWRCAKPEAPIICVTFWARIWKS